MVYQNTGKTHTRRWLLTDTNNTFFVFSVFAFGLRALYRLWPKGESHSVIGVLCIQYFRRCTTRPGIERRCTTTLYELPSLILIEENRRRKMMPTKPMWTKIGPSPTRSLSSTIYYKFWIFILMSTHGTRFFRKEKIRSLRRRLFTCTLLHDNRNTRKVNLLLMNFAFHRIRHSSYSMSQWIIQS